MDAEDFIKGELSKVLVTKDAVAGNLVPSQKAIDLVEEMNDQLKGELGLVGRPSDVQQRMLELFRDPTSIYFSFIKVH